MDHHPSSTSHDQEYEDWQMVRGIVRYEPWTSQLSYQWMSPAKQTNNFQISDLRPNGWTCRNFIFLLLFLKKFWAMMVMKKQEETWSTLTIRGCSLSNTLLRRNVSAMAIAPKYKYLGCLHNLGNLPVTGVFSDTCSSSIDRQTENQENVNSIILSWKLKDHA